MRPIGGGTLDAWLWVEAHGLDALCTLAQEHGRPEAAAEAARVLAAEVDNPALLRMD